MITLSARPKPILLLPKSPDFFNRT